MASQATSGAPFRRNGPWAGGPNRRGLLPSWHVVTHMPRTPPGGPKTYAIGAGGTDCDHESRREMASDAGANRYFRCPDCGGVLVREPPMKGEGTDADLGTVDPAFEDLLEDLEHYHDRNRASVLGRAVAAVKRLVR